MHSLVRLVCPSGPFIQALYPYTSTDSRRSQLPTSCRLQQNQDIVVGGHFRVEVLKVEEQAKGLIGTDRSAQALQEDGTKDAIQGILEKLSQTLCNH